MCFNDQFKMFREQNQKLCMGQPLSGKHTRCVVRVAQNEQNGPSARNWPRKKLREPPKPRQPPKPRNLRLGLSLRKVLVTKMGAETILIFFACDSFDSIGQEDEGTKILRF